jgi:hypothetical protein
MAKLEVVARVISTRPASREGRNKPLMKKLSRYAISTTSKDSSSDSSSDKDDNHDIAGIIIYLSGIYATAAPDHASCRCPIPKKFMTGKRS